MHWIEMELQSRQTLIFGHSNHLHEHPKSRILLDHSSCFTIQKLHWIIWSMLDRFLFVEVFLRRLNVVKTTLMSPSDGLFQLRVGWPKWKKEFSWNTIYLPHSQNCREVEQTWLCDSFVSWLEKMPPSLNSLGGCVCCVSRYYGNLAKSVNDHIDIQQQQNSVISIVLFGSNAKIYSVQRTEHVNTKVAYSSFGEPPNFRLAFQKTFTVVIWPYSHSERRSSRMVSPNSTFSISVNTRLELPNPVAKCANQSFGWNRIQNSTYRCQKLFHSLDLRSLERSLYITKEEKVARC
jgi:hypothetical protein